MKKILRITESDLHRIIRNSVNKIVKESVYDNSFFNKDFDNKLRKALQLLRQGDLSGFDYTHQVPHGVFLVLLDNKYNFITTQGNVLYKEWFDGISGSEGDDKTSDCLPVFKYDKGCNIISLDTFKLLSEKWYRYITCFYGNYAIVTDFNQKQNLIDKEGNMLSDEWFDNVKMAHYRNHNIIATVELNGEEFLIDKDGNLLD